MRKYDKEIVFQLQITEQKIASVNYKIGLHTKKEQKSFQLVSLEFV
jgi:hypothetical protein